MTLPNDFGRLPSGITPLPPQVALGDCEDCGREAGDGYTIHLPADRWLLDLRDMGWDVVDGRVLCFDCAVGRCPECGQAKGNPDCTECAS